MSHELRTPLNAILGFSQLLHFDGESGNLTDKQISEVDEIYKAGEHLLQLINEVLDLSKIEIGKVDFNMQPVGILKVINESTSIIESQLSKYSVELEIAQSCQENLTVYADEIRLRQVLLNLLTNAVKYNRPSGRVTIDCSVHGNQLAISVEDTGPGIPPEHLGDLFTAFNRLGAETSEIEGTGIGLSITKKLVNLMGGEIRVSSEVDVGSIFTIYINLYEGGRSHSVENVEDVAEAPGTLDKATQRNKYKVLYIEDNPANIRLMESMFEYLHGYELITTNDPSDGLVTSKQQKIDLVLLDINLPGINGFEVLRELRSAKQTASVPVIGVSANAMPEDIEKAQDAGFDAYLCKPVELASLRAKMSELLNMSLLANTGMN